MSKRADLCTKLASFSTALLAALLSACGSPAELPPAVIDVPTEGDGGEIEIDDDASSYRPPDVEVRAGDAKSPSLGELGIEDVPNTPCVPSRADAVPLSEGLATASGFDRVGQLGERRFAFSAAGSVAITFGYDGTAPSMPILGPLAVAAQNGDLEALVATADGLGLQVYDAQGTARGAAVGLESTMPVGLSLGAGPTETLATWCSSDDVVGRLLDQSHVPGPIVSLAPGSGGDQACRTATLWNGMTFTVVWTRRLQNTRTKTSIAFIDLDGNLSITKTVVLSDGSHHLVDLVQAPFGYILLLVEEEGAGSPVVIRLDRFGNILPPAIRLQGSREGFSVATFGSQFAISAILGDGRAAMRPFNSAAKVLGPWVCVDDRPPSMPLAGRAALGIDDQGYAVVARMSDGSNWYMRTNEVGDRAPGGD